MLGQRIDHAFGALAVLSDRLDRRLSLDRAPVNMARIALCSLHRGLGQPGERRQSPYSALFKRFERVYAILVVRCLRSLSDGLCDLPIAFYGHFVVKLLLLTLPSLCCCDFSRREQGNNAGQLRPLAVGLLVASPSPIEPCGQIVGHAGLGHGGLVDLDGLGRPGLHFGGVLPVLLFGLLPLLFPLRVIGLHRVAGQKARPRRLRPQLRRWRFHFRQRHLCRVDLAVKRLHRGVFGFGAFHTAHQSVLLANLGRKVGLQLPQLFRTVHEVRRRQLHRRGLRIVASFPPLAAVWVRADDHRALAHLGCCFHQRHDVHDHVRCQLVALDVHADHVGLAVGLFEVGQRIAQVGVSVHVAAVFLERLGVGRHKVFQRQHVAGLDFFGHCFQSVAHCRLETGGIVNRAQILVVRGARRICVEGRLFAPGVATTGSDVPKGFQLFDSDDNGVRLHGLPLATKSGSTHYGGCTPLRGYNSP